MEAMIARNAESSTLSLPTNADLSKRRCTDKYWSVLFVVAIIIWVVAGPQVVRVKSDVKINYFDNMILENTTSKHENTTITNATALYVSHVLGKHWLLDVLTCNAGFLDTNYSRSGLIVIWAHVLFSICLLIYIFASMRTDKIYRKQFYKSIKILLVVSTLTQDIFMYKYTLDTKSIKHVADLVLNIISWFLPGAILLTIGCTIDVSSERDVFKRNDDGGDNGSDNSSSIHLEDYLGVPIIVIGRLMKIFCIIAFFIFMFIVLFVNENETGFEYKLIWRSEWFANGIAISAACYVILIIYYFMLMVTSYSVSIFYEKSYDGNIKLRAWFMIARYHFGTVCYHATLIFPRIHATFMMNQKDFRRNPKVSAIYRFYLMYWKISNLSPTLTAVRGYSHSQSTRELLRFFNSDSANFKKLQTFSQTHKCSSTLLMVIYNLIAISFWIHGVTINPGYITTTWLAYLFSIYITYIFTKFLDATVDVLWYLNDGTVIIKF